MKGAILSYFVLAWTAGNSARFVFWTSTLLFAISLFAWLPLTGLTASETSLSIIHVVLFYLIPGLAVTLALGWDRPNRRADLVLVWALGLGLALQPILILPFWATGLERGSLLLPLIASIALWRGRTQLGVLFGDGVANWSWRSHGWQSLLFAGFIGVTIFFCVVHAFTFAPLEFHLVHQGVITRAILQGFPPESPFVEGIPLSYNYAAHLLMADMLNHWPVSPVVSAGRLFPIISLCALILLVFAFAVEELRLPGWIALTTVAGIFWIVGYGPLTQQLYGTLIAPSNIRIIGPLFALVVLLVAVRLIGEVKGKLTLALTLRILLFGFLVFAATGYRGPAGLILICMAAFLAAVPIMRWKRPDLPAALMAACGAVGFFAACIVFFTLGSEISGTSFATASTTFRWLSENDVFLIVRTLKSIGTPALFAGVITFIVMAIMQAGFLTPAFFAKLVDIRINGAPKVALALLGAAIAGIFGTMLTSAPGGSHFSFIHYANLSMSLLGGCGLGILIGWALVPGRRRLAARATLVGCAALALMSLWEIGFQLKDYSREKLSLVFERPQLLAFPDLEPLVYDLRPGDKMLHLAEDNSLDHLAILYNLNLVAASRPISMYEHWDTPLAQKFAARHQVAQQLHAEAEQGIVREELLREFAETLVDRTRRYFVIAPKAADVSDTSSLSLMRSTDSFSLYRWEIAK